jgi:Na+-translocating ferredoxin:NAD+ oxidoreductase RnfG subunit
MCSDRIACGRLVRGTVALVGLLLLLAAPLSAKVFFSQKEALQVAFPEATRIERETHILEEAEAAAIEKRSRSALDSRLVAIHTAWRGEELLGFAHIEVHTVRTKAEGFMVVLGPNGAVNEVRVLAFYEPLEYLPTQRWYDRFTGKAPTDRLRLGWDVDAVSGATLSARAATEGVRRVLAYYEVLLSH